MLKENAEAFRDIEEMFFGPKFKEALAKSLTTKNRSRELFGNLKEQGTSPGNMDFRKQQPFQKTSLFRARGIRGRGIFSQVGQLGNLKFWDTEKWYKYFLTHPISGYPSSCPTKKLQDTPISDTSVSSEHFNFTKGRKVKIFSQKLGKINKRPYNFIDNAMLQYPFYCAARTNKSHKSGNNVTRRNRFGRSGDQENAEQGYNFSSEKSRWSVSKRIALGREKGWGGRGGEGGRGIV